jgi:sec-independent protein translocase protein TatC
MFESMRPHLAELRKRLSISVLAVFVMFGVAFGFHNTILTWVTKPLNDALTQVGSIIESQNKTEWKIKVENNSTLAPLPKTPSQLSLQAQENLEKAAKEADPKLAPLLIDASTAIKALTSELKRLDRRITTQSFEGKITTHQVGGAFFVALKVSIFAAILFALPVILWQLWLFIAPGLYDNEKKLVIPFVFGGTGMFAIGVLFAYYIVTPFGFQFLITFGSFLYTPLINIEDYVGFFTKILLGFGVAFELPVVASFLGIIGLVTDKTLIGFFKFAIVIIFVLAALLTPPDVLTQLLMAAPLILLYGASILLLKLINPYKEEDEEEEMESESESREIVDFKNLKS